MDRNQLVLDHLDLIDKIALAEARRFRWAMHRDRAVDRDDFVQQARLAAVRLSRAYDPERGVTFSTFLIGNLHNRLFDWLRARILKRGKLGEAHNTAGSLLSLDPPTGDAESTFELPLADLERTDSEAEVRVWFEQIWAEVMDLDAPHRMALLAGSDREAGVSLAQVATVLGVTESRVSQMRRAAERHLKARCA